MLSLPAMKSTEASDRKQTAQPLQPPEQPIPVTVLTGFLGAGKTTFLNYLLSEQKEYKIAVIINEIGQINVDSKLVHMADDSMLEFSNGCICCTVRSDLVKAIASLIRKSRFDYIVVEPTGLADPGPIAQTFLNIPELQSYVRLDSIIAVVDALNFFAHCQASPTTEAQVELADFIILNKVDLADEAKQERVRKRLAELNPHATIHTATQGRIDLKHIWDVHAFKVDEKLVTRPNLLDETVHTHDERIKAHSLTFDRPFNLSKLEQSLQRLSETHRVLRAKGFLSIQGEANRAIFHGVNDRYSIYWENTKPSAKPESQLVFIGEKIAIDQIREELIASLA